MTVCLPIAHSKPSTLRYSYLFLMKQNDRVFIVWLEDPEINCNDTFSHLLFYFQSYNNTITIIPLSMIILCMYTYFVFSFSAFRFIENYDFHNESSLFFSVKNRIFSYILYGLGNNNRSRVFIMVGFCLFR